MPAKLEFKVDVELTNEEEEIKNKLSKLCEFLGRSYLIHGSGDVETPTWYPGSDFIWVHNNMGRDYPIRLSEKTSYLDNKSRSFGQEMIEEAEKEALEHAKKLEIRKTNARISNRARSVVENLYG